MMWYSYKSIHSDREMVLCQIDETTTISGFADSVPEYLAWVAEGNEAGPWEPAEQE